MQLTCPACGYCSGLVGFSSDSEARYFAALMGKVPPELSDALLRYLAMFSPAKHKLTWPRARRLLDELAPDIQRGAIERRRRQWLAPAVVWLRAFEHMHEQRPSLQLPLRSHGYLYEVIVGLVDKAEATAEKSVEQQRRTDPRVGKSSGTTAAVADHLDVDAIREAHIRTVMGNITARRGEDHRRQRPATSLQDYAHSYREQFGDVVVDAALNRLQTPIQQEHS